MITKTAVAWTLLLALSTVGAAGCTNQAGRQSAPDGVRAQNIDQNVIPPGNAVARSTASHLESLARGVHGVQGANCVVFGKYAIVGIDVDPRMERSRVGTVKYAVAEAFRKDPAGINALVTADIDIAQRLREIRADVRAGRPVAGFAEELADIVGRLMPQIPRNVIPPQAPENTGAPNASVRGR